MSDITTEWFIAVSKQDIIDNIGYEDIQPMKYPVVVMELQVDTDVLHVFVQLHELEDMITQLKESTYEHATTA